MVAITAQQYPLKAPRRLDFAKNSMSWQENSKAKEMGLFSHCTALL